MSKDFHRLPISEAEIAETFARYKHRKHFRRDGVTPYVTHLEDVASRVVGDKPKAVAWVHDYIEDIRKNIPAAIAEFRELGLSEEVIEAVVLLTKKAGQKYEEYVKLISENKLAAKVKVADMLSNLSDTPTPRQKIKYGIGLALLLPPDKP